MLTDLNYILRRIRPSSLADIMNITRANISKWRKDKKVPKKHRQTLKEIKKRVLSVKKR